MSSVEMKIIAKIQSDFATKFAVPRQSGLSNVQSKIVFEPEFANADAVRGLEGFSHIWLLWYFSENERAEWSPTVRPPKLGGNKRIGVFATRSPFRPNAIGLSSVRLDKIEFVGNAPVLYVSGADLVNGTPIFDIKPYLPYTDCHINAVGGFADNVANEPLKVVFEAQTDIDDKLKTTITDLLAQDPRPAYHDDPDRIYGFVYAENEIKFRVDGDTVFVTGVEKK